MTARKQARSEATEEEWINRCGHLLRALRLALPILEASARAERIRNRLTVARDCTSEHALNAANAAIEKASA